MKYIISILIDSSGSMGTMDSSKEYQGKFLVGEKTRMDLAKVLLTKEIVPSMEGADEVITQIFRSDVKIKKTEYHFVQSCPYDLAQINQGINHISDPLAGGTPITQALEQTFAKLLSYASPDDKKMIILITDGEENGGGNYPEMIKKIGSYDCEVHIIGLSLSQPLKDIASLAVKHAHGTFTDVEIASGASFDSVVVSATQKLEQLKQTLYRFLANKKSSPSLTETEEDALRNEEIRIASEKHLFKHLKQQYGSRVRWLNDPDETGGDHDFKILELDCDETAIYVECKGTPGNKPTFYLTANEWRLALKHGSKYELYFVQNCFAQPKITTFTNLLISLAAGRLLPYSLEEEHLQPNRIALTVATA